MGWERLAVAQSSNLLDPYSWARNIDAFIGILLGRQRGEGHLLLKISPTEDNYQILIVNKIFNYRLPFQNVTILWFVPPCDIFTSFASNAKH